MQMQVVKALRFRVYPTSGQAKKIDTTIDCCRFVYNHMLSRNSKVYKRRGEHMNYYTMQNLLPKMKAYLLWLKDADARALQYACRQVDQAFNRFFKRLGGYPNFKSKRSSVQSYTTTHAKTIHYEAGRVKIPCVGWLRVADKRKLIGDICYATVIRDGNQYYVSITYKTTVSCDVVDVDADKVIGLDYKSDGLYVSSNGECADMPHFYRKAQDALAKEQRRLSRNVGSRKGERKSGNYLRQMKRLRKKSRKVANQRKDFLHKQSTAIAKQCDAVCVETLNMRAMANKGFGNGKTTMDNGYGMFLNMLDYKLQWRGKQLVFVDRWFPSSQICHCCGTKNPALKNLQIRKWICPNCGAAHDRDVNAACNIKNEGLRLMA